MGNKLNFREENIQAVAEWWAGQLRNGSSTQKPDVKELEIAKALQKRLGPSESKIEVFKEKLIDLLRNSECPPPFDDRTSETWGVISTRHVLLHVDYHATGLLLAACRFAGISDMAFPWKTFVSMSYNMATVKQNGKYFYLYGDDRTSDSL